MQVNDWLNQAVAALQESGIDSARLDSLILLEDVLRQDRAWLLAHLEMSLTSSQLRALAGQLERRLQHEPIAYIRGHAEFYGRRFEVTPDVLVPRPETETMIDMLKELAPRGLKIADIGTGSGALAITAALETGAVAAGVDIDEACLAVAERNAVMHTTSLQLLKGNLTAPFLLPGNDFWPQVILANLPYVPADYPINQAARYEPALALFGGSDGLDLYRRLFKQVTKLPQSPQLILTEALPQQQSALVALALSSGYQQQMQRDFIQAFCMTD